MSVQELIDILRRRLVYLGQLRSSAVQLGDVQQTEQIDAELAATQATLNTLLTLPE